MDDPNFRNFVDHLLKCFKSGKVEQIPYRRDKNFVGRGRLLSSIETRMETERVVALSGPYGVGKTALAVEYSYRFMEKYPCAHFFWVHGRTMETIERGFRNIARALDIPGHDRPDGDIFKAVRQGISRRAVGPWLLVLDGLDDRRVCLGLSGNGSHGSLLWQARLIDYLPQSDAGHIILTTQDKRVGYKFAGLKNVEEIPPLEFIDAQHLLTSLLRQSTPACHAEDTSQLVLALQGLPLLIVRAASYITTREVTIRQYLCVFDDYAAAKDLSVEHDLDPDLLQLSEDAVRMPSRILYDSVKQQSPRALELLCIIAMMDARSISIEILRTNYDSSVELLNDIGYLKELSIVTTTDANGGYISLHKFEHLWVLRWLEQAGELERWQEKALYTLLGFCSCRRERERWSCLDRIYLHVQMVVRYEFTKGSSLLKKAHLLHLASEYNLERGQARTAETQLRESITIRKRLDPQYSSYMTDLADLARILHFEGKLIEAEPIFREVVSLNSKIFGDEHDATLNSLILLTSVLIPAKKYHEAESILSKILQSRSKTKAKQFRDVAARHNLGWSAFLQNNPSKAQRILKDVLQEKERTSGTEVRSIAETMTLLGSVMAQKQLYADAEGLFNKSWKLYEQALGAIHPDTIRTMDLLTGALYNLGKLTELTYLLPELIERKKQIFGMLNRDTLDTVNTFEVILIQMTRYNEAENSIAHTLQLSEGLLGNDDPQTMRSKMNLAVARCGQGRKDEALALVRQVFEDRKRILGLDDPLTIKTKEKYGWMSKGCSPDRQEFYVDVRDNIETRITITLCGPTAEATT
ncbi:P-loop containing nucleoside triphosphate hydrolase protein [Aspergillus pseudocaelatus]|uniref:P-loop containing nucleoside triphosphate hydrolase protein n=1 Tax=Aspergillus pseudocaelatus TaxID=1825620 RepID=A0ABQ6WR17_9EURO|nr:P-loop containing nucleoside triphosphate hydrolase protein [Aspergillus pseudocaelatus]